MSTTRTIEVRPGLRLEARASGDAGKPVVVIAPPHPVYGGTIGSPVVRALESAFAGAGFATLAFNFRGTGDSDGVPSGEPADGVEDYLAAVKSAGGELAYVSGYSFGACVALKAAVALAAPRALLVAPAMGWLDHDALKAHDGRLLVVAAEDDEYAPQQALAAALEQHRNAKLVVVPDSEHFFIGSAVPRLSEALRAVLAAG